MMWLVTEGQNIVGFYPSKDKALERYEEKVREVESVNVRLDAEVDPNYSICISEVERRFHIVVNTNPTTHAIETQEGDVIEFASDETSWSTAEEVKG